MIATRCQVCGRRKHLRKNGSIVHHFVGGDRCAGSGFPPIEESDARLVELHAQAEEQWRIARRAIRELEDRRANYIDPQLLARRSHWAAESLRLEKRLRRIQGWAARYERTWDRHMMTQGYVWADKPPAYLISRYLEDKAWTPPAFR